MGISKKMLIAFVLTIFLAISSVRCSDRTFGFGIKQEYTKCYDLKECQKPKFDDAACERFCGAKSFLLYGKCDTTTGQCCCRSKT
ncbi:hypothetical protein CARUB_v10015235mg [Capsella rubella]|uniref:Knottin scorpion toxin-like domain-containing protein n=1 Tax=Capsella rubella TaxID=81985 RepID=R0I295_9BRAS|nr:defensin-like protein 112 [Capsella rubella]EOA31995.1 hypothetical protein CARUB_v10015235mg [Capsella rubella]